MFEDLLKAQPRIMTFTLDQVTKEDAGTFVCVSGFGKTPSYDNCGQMLIVVGEKDTTKAKKKKNRFVSGFPTDPIFRRRP